METRKNGLEKAREKLDQKKQMKIKLAESRRKIVLNVMDESMEPGPSRYDPNIDLPSMEVSSENGLIAMWCCVRHPSGRYEEEIWKFDNSKRALVNRLLHHFAGTDGETRREGVSKAGSEEADDVQNISSRSMLK
uniref:UBX domain-containing protein n=1 Tax=Bursaphelenchus xylophilus TaxID=6326 RepID=A0A1I7SNE1_BURXY